MHRLPEVYDREGRPLPDARDAILEYFDAVGVAEIADRAGVKPNTVMVWRQRHDDFPAPIVELKMGPVWFWADVQPWVEAQKQRGPGRPTTDKVRSPGSRSA